MNRNEMKKKKKKKKKRLKIFLLSLLVIFIAIVGYGGYLAYKITNATTEAQRELERGKKSERREDIVDVGKDSFSVLFIGVDARDGEQSRSDALILATFNKSNNSVKMVSIPRDSKVEIEDHGLDKINHAHFFGGVDLTVETVENLFDIPVDNYVKLNFDAFIEVIDSLGGIQINSERAFTEQNSKGVKGAISIEEGIQQVNGEEALAYVRMRKKDPLGDIGRGERQKEVIKAIISKSSNITSVTKYDDIIDSIGKNMTTSFNLSEILSMQKYAGAIDNIESLKLEGYDDSDPSSGIYYYSLEDESVETISDELKEHLELENTTSTN